MKRLWSTLPFTALLISALFSCHSARAQFDGNRGPRGGSGIARDGFGEGINPEAAPPDNLFAMLSARGIRSGLQAKDLTAAWRILRISGAPEQTALWQMMVQGQNANSTPWDDLYYTRGDVISLTGQTYLVAYRVALPSDPAERQRQVQYLRAMQNGNGDDDTIIQTEAPPLEENAALSLSLLSISQGASLHDIKSFDPEKDILTTATKNRQKVSVERGISATNLKQVGLGLLQYTQDYDELLPPMRAARTAAEITGALANTSNVSTTSPVQVMLMPYIKSAQVFLHPGTKRPYLPNYKISRANLSVIDNPAQTIAFFEDAPDAEGKRNILFLDGHVKAYSEAEFQVMRKAQGISESGLPITTPPKSKPKAKPASNPPPGAAPPRAT